MQIKAKPGRIDQTEDESILLGCFEDDLRLAGVLKAMEEKLSGAIGLLFQTGDFTGKLGQTAVLYPQDKLPSKRIILAGLGEKGQICLEKIRRAYGHAGRKVKELKVESLSAQAFQSQRLDIKLQEATQAMVEGLLLSHYKLERYKTDEGSQRIGLKNLSILEQDGKKITEIEKGAKVGEIFSWATNFTRDLANQPSNYLTPERFSRVATHLAQENNFSCKIFSGAQIKRLKMNAFLGVASGSSQPPKLIVLEYRPALRKTKTLALVGKGMTFDAGGLSLKPTEDMLEMKADMTGGAVVLSTLAAGAKLKLPFHLFGIIPAAENLPSGSALKIGDIITSHSGKTIEVLNTDAEGRLILADALSYARGFKPDVIIDVATLTSAIKIALGTVCAGIFSTNETLKTKLIQAGEKTGERVWEMPLWDEYQEFLKSDLADIKNVGGKWGGASIAAGFLKNFVKETPWIHLDIAGVDFKDKEDAYHPKGATGFGVRLLLQWLKDW